MHSLCPVLDRPCTIISPGKAIPELLHPRPNRRRGLLRCLRVARSRRRLPASHGPTQLASTTFRPRRCLPAAVAAGAPVHRDALAQSAASVTADPTVSSSSWLEQQELAEVLDHHLTGVEAIEVSEAQ
jgi:hypothetical protein